MTGKTLHSTATRASDAAGQLDIDRKAVASRLGESASQPTSGTTPYPGVSFADVVAAANPQKRSGKRAKPRSA